MLIISTFYVQKQVVFYLRRGAGNIRGGGVTQVYLMRLSTMLLRLTKSSTVKMVVSVGSIGVVAMPRSSFMLMLSVNPTVMIRVPSSLALLA